ncbi:hypothetical protein D9M71_719800 [compost metagenome]
MQRQSGGKTQGADDLHDLETGLYFQLAVLGGQAIDHFLRALFVGIREVAECGRPTHRVDFPVAVEKDLPGGGHSLFRLSHAPVIKRGESLSGGRVDAVAQLPAVHPLAIDPVLC